MIKNKKILILIVLVFIIVACVDFFSLSINDKNKQSSSQVKIIKFASWGSQSEVEILKPILAEFEKENPDIKIKFIHIPQNYFQKIHLLFASNLAPDVIFINNLYLPIYANAGVLEPINDAKKNVFYNKALQALSYNGKLYAIPRDVSNLIIYYNKNIFDKYNITYPHKNWSFDDFLVSAQKLTKDTNSDGKTDIWGISFEEDPTLYYLPYLMSSGGGILSDDLKTLIFNSPQSQKGLIFYSNLRNKYHVAPSESESASATMAQLFLQEKLAMQLSGRWLVPKYRTDANFDWDVVNFPKGDKGSIVPLDASGWSVSKSSNHKNEAMRLINFLSSKESIEKFTHSGLIVPARIDVANSTFVTDSQNPQNNRAFLDAIKTSKPTPVSVNYGEIQDDIKKKTNYIFNSYNNP